MATRINQLLTQNLQCPICLNTYTEPKLLVCSHTFCSGCLKRLFKSQKDSRDLQCPICHKVTSIPEGDIGSLQTNIPIKNMVEDIKNQSQVCSICKMDPKPLAVTYCQECDDFMCVDCHKTHDKWDKFSGHEVVKVEDIVSGKVVTKQRRKCKKHKTEIEECFCADCKRYVCFRCGMMEHSKAGHNVLEGMEHEESQKEKIKELRDNADTKKSQVDEYISFIEKQQEVIKRVLEGLKKEISDTCEESMQQLQERRDLLIKDCNKRIEKLNKELQDMKDEGRLQIGQIDDVSGLVANGIKVPLEGESLAAHETLCGELEGILGKTDPDYNRPKTKTKTGEKISFLRVRSQIKGQSQLDLGKIEVVSWVHGKTITFKVKDSVNCIAAMPDGRMAAGSRFGGLSLVSLDGSQEDALKGIGIRQLVFLSNGRVAVRDIYNTLSLYDESFTKLDSEYAALSHDNGGFGGLAINVGESSLLANFSKVKMLITFPLTGGQAESSISGDFGTGQLFMMRSGRLLVTHNEYSVSIIDVASGEVMHNVTKQGEGVHAQPAPCLDGTVLIAWVKQTKIEGRLTIEQYSSDLTYLKTLVSSWKISLPQRPWYHLREFSSGEIAFCTPDKMYIFNKVALVNDIE